MKNTQAVEAVEAAEREIDLILSDPETNLSHGARRGLLWLRMHVASRPQEVAAPVGQPLTDVEFDELWLLFSRFEAQYNRADTDEALAKKRADIDDWFGKHFAASRVSVALGGGEVLDVLRIALQNIAHDTDPDNGKNYRADDREGCLDSVFSTATNALSHMKE